MLKQEDNPDALWRQAVDPNSGRTYYYEINSKQSTWEKPEELITTRELYERRKKREDDLKFFEEMENNVLARINKHESLNTQEQHPVDHTLDLAPFSPTSSQSQPSDSASTVSAKEYVPSLLSVPSSASDISRSSTTSSSTGTSSGPSHQRRNTTGTISLKETPFTLDVDGTIRSICTVYRIFIVESMSEALPSTSPASVHDIFTDLEASVFDDSCGPPLCRYKGTSTDLKCHSEFHVDDPHGTGIPSLNEIICLFTYLYDHCQCESDVLIPSLLYCERLMTETKGVVQPDVRNWRSILLSCLTLASKVWDDCSMWPIDFSCVCQKGPISLRSYSLHRINKLEVAFLKMIGFNAHISASEYTRCYFYLQELSLPATSKHLLDMDSAAVFGMLKLRSLENSPRISNKAANHKRGNSVDEREFLGSDGLAYERSTSICLESIVSL